MTMVQLQRFILCLIIWEDYYKWWPCKEKEESGHVTTSKEIKECGHVLSEGTVRESTHTASAKLKLILTNLITENNIKIISIKYAMKIWTELKWLRIISSDMLWYQRISSFRFFYQKISHSVNNMCKHITLHGTYCITKICSYSPQNLKVSHVRHCWTLFWARSIASPFLLFHPNNITWTLQTLIYQMSVRKVYTTRNSSWHFLSMTQENMYLEI